MARRIANLLCGRKQPTYFVPEQHTGAFPRRARWNDRQDECVWHSLQSRYPARYTPYLLALWTLDQASRRRCSRLFGWTLQTLNRFPAAALLNDRQRQALPGAASTHSGTRRYRLPLKSPTAGSLSVLFFSCDWRIFLCQSSKYKTPWLKPPGGLGHNNRRKNNYGE